MEQAIIHQELNMQENQDCQALWKAVILQALLNLKSISKKKYAKSNRNQAGKSINLYNKNFIRVEVAILFRTVI